MQLRYCENYILMYALILLCFRCLQLTAESMLTLLMMSTSYNLVSHFI